MTHSLGRLLFDLILRFLAKLRLRLCVENPSAKFCHGTLVTFIFRVYLFVVGWLLPRSPLLYRSRGFLHSLFSHFSGRNLILTDSGFILLI